MVAVSLAVLPMTVRDLDACWKLDQVCFADGESYDRETFRDLLTHRDTLCFKALGEAGTMVGFVVGMIEADRTGHVVVLGVSPGWRRRGIGRRLMRAVEAAFADHNVALIHLEVRTTNDGARRLYEGLGFTVAGRRLSYYTNGDDGYLMIKGL